MGRVCVVLLADELTNKMDVIVAIKNSIDDIKYLLLVTPTSEIKEIKGVISIDLDNLYISTVTKHLMNIDADMFYFGLNHINFCHNTIKRFSNSYFDIQIFDGVNLSFHSGIGKTKTDVISDRFIYHLLKPDNVLLSKLAISSLQNESHGDIKYIAHAALISGKSCCIVPAAIKRSRLKADEKIHSIINSIEYYKDESIILHIYSTLLNPADFSRLIGDINEKSATTLINFFQKKIAFSNCKVTPSIESVPFYAQWFNSIKSNDPGYFVSVFNRIKNNEFYSNKSRVKDFSGTGATLNNPEFTYVNSMQKEKVLSSKVTFDYSVIGDGEFGRHRDGWNFVLQNALERFPHDPNSIGFDGFIEKSFVWNYGLEPVGRKKEWFGITHRPIDIPHFYGWKHKLKFYQSPYFNLTADNMRGLITVSTDHAEYLRSIFDVPVICVLHPTNFNVPKWDANTLEQPKIRLVQIGTWLRKLHSIFRLPQGGYEKTILAEKERLFSDDRFVSEAKYLKGLGKLVSNPYESVNFLGFLEDHEYDSLLMHSVVFLDMYSATANNTILECIARHTPIVVRRMASTVEYLGEDYPLFFESLEEAAEIASNRNLILEAHLYLKKRATYRPLHISGFLENLACAVNKIV